MRQSLFSFLIASVVLHSASFWEPLGSNNISDLFLKESLLAAQPISIQLIERKKHLTTPMVKASQFTTQTIVNKSKAHKIRKPKSTKGIKESNMADSRRINNLANGLQGFPSTDLNAVTAFNSLNPSSSRPKTNPNSTDHSNFKPSLTPAVLTSSSKTTSYSSDPKSIDIYYRPSPHYPMEALKQQMEGELRVEVHTDGAGFVKSIHLEQSTGHSLLDMEALQTVKKWRLTPNSVFHIPFNFKIVGKSENQIDHRSKE